MSAPADHEQPIRRATVVGTGLIGGSIARALRERGWRVSGVDSDDARTSRALELGVVDEVGYDPEAELTFVATPVGQITDAVKDALAHTAGVVTDVGGVKASVVDAIDDPRFVGGHPMAGSEQEGVDGATADIFDGAVWVLTPVAGTDPGAFTLVRSTVASFGAEVVEVAPERHDQLVAVVSHVPHLTAAALMRLASTRAEEQGGLLRLAAGGFRDMTRIASGHPGIWPDICESNRAAIVQTLDELVAALREMREVVDASDRSRLLGALGEARRARNTLPARSSRPSELVEVRVPIQDQPGELSGVTTLATDLEVNIYDIEIDHAAESTRGLLVLVVAADMAERLIGGLMARGYRPTSRPLE
ncbi:prephenate dehydrogenase/arogenate dehydrogenase family protein [Actinomarinicola tropica]|uniref:Prephenate dehydrogenase/arogenate dehydrogenase family protein n=1 Tax=Actinomarinicola tropica TaxID=2789776 RepID=A0A5Q2REA5_9ACTN|nr:prephenate dehydrogenase/arogenate dehydrogenase family protein [Actinomarinicola tropica]QGG95238.1 prephenate dehydrogenase/arogenate dehydrogenase family protein [Actinomarinicola tropica]